MSDKQDHCEKLLSLDERREANRLCFMVGKYGVAWVFDVLIEIFQEIAKDQTRECCETVNAETRILLFTGLKLLFSPQTSPTKDSPGSSQE